MPTIDYFGFLAPFYDHVIKPNAPKKLWGLAELPTDGWLLDAGGGTGRMAQFMRGKAAQVVVADMSFKMLQQANEKGGLETVCCHTEKLPFPENLFECVIMIDALHHVCDQMETARELWRVLISGGRLVIEEPDINKFTVKIIAIAEKFLLMRSKFLAPSEIVKLFHFSNARVQIDRDKHISWIIAKKI